MVGVASAQITTPSAPFDWRVPVHTGPVDPVHGAYGHWAAGRDFKASFGAEFAFYPRLGKRYSHNMPLVWRTTGVTAGGAPWIAPSESPRVYFSDWRYERSHGGRFVEIYDVLAEGVEQSFLLRERPPFGGDVVVHGHVESELNADDRAPQHADLEFRAPATGEVLVRYGCAFAVDARGDKIELGSSFDGSSIGLRVPATWLATAAFPVTIDPLVQRGVLGGELGSTAVLDSDSATAADPDVGDASSVFVVHSREFTDGDIDAYGFSYDGDDFGNARRIWQDLATFDTLRPRVAYCQPNDKWVIAFERRSGTTGAVRGYSQDRLDLTTMGGTTHFLPGVSGQSSIRPDIGGRLATSSLSSPLVLFVFERGSTTSANGNPIYVRPFLFSVNGWGTEHQIDAGLLSQTREVTIGKTDVGGLEWMVAFLVRPFLASSWRPAVVPVNFGGTVDTPTVLGAPSSPDVTTTDVHVDGSRFQAMIAYREVDSSSLLVTRRACYERFDWTGGAAQVIREASLANGALSTTIDVDGIAYDLDTRSHWCILHRVNDTLTATRTGFTGGIVEQAVVASDPGTGAASVTSAIDTTPASDTWGKFQIAWADFDLFYPVKAAQLEYPVAGTVPIGSSCFGAELAATPNRDQPLAGNGRFSIRVSGPPFGSPATTFVLSPAPGFVPLDVIGAPGCALNVDPATMVTIGSTVPLFGEGSLDVPLPDDPVFTGDVYFQAFWLDVGLNDLGVGTTNGLLVQVR